MQTLFSKYVKPVVRSVSYRLFVMFLLFFTVKNYGQTGSLPDTVRIKPVIVSARAPAADTLRDLSGETAFSLQNPGLQLNSYGRGQIATVSISGLPARYTGIFVSDLNLVPASSGVVDMSMFPFYLFDYAVVSPLTVNTARSGLAGDLVFDFSHSNVSQAELQTGAGSFSTFFVRSGLEFSSGKSYASIRSYYLESKNDYPYRNPYLPGSPVVRNTGAQFRRSAVAAFFRSKFSKTELELFTVHFNGEREFPPPISYQGTERKENSFDIRNFSEIKVSRRYAHFKTGAYAGYDAMLQNYSLGYDGTTALLSNSNYLSLQSGLWLSAALWRIKWENKADFYRNMIDYVSTTGINASRFSTVLSIDGQLSVQNTVIRYLQALHRAGGQLFYTGSVMLSPVRTLTLSFDRNVSLPTLNDLYWQPGGNPLLLPEKSSGLTVKYKSRHSGIVRHISIVSGFKLIKNQIVWQPTEYHYWIAKNLEQATAFLLDLTLESKPREIANNRLVFTLSYGFHRLSDTLGRQLVYTPMHRGLATVTLKNRLFTARLQGLYESFRYTVPGVRELALPGYFVANLAVESKNFEFRQIKLNFILEANNLTGTQYELVPGRPQPGFNWFFKIKIQTNDVSIQKK